MNETLLNSAMKPFQCFGTVPYSTENDPSTDDVLNDEDGSSELS